MLRLRLWMPLLSCLMVLSGVDNDRQLAAADIKYPIAVATQADGTIFLADRNLPGIWRIKEGKRELYFEASKKFRTPLNAVRCLAIDHMGRLLAGDSATRDVYRFNADGKPEPLTNGGVGIPMVLAVDKTGNLYIGDLETQRIFRQPVEGGELTEFAIVSAPRGLAFDAQDRLWCVAYGRKDILRFAADGKPEVIVGGGPFQFPNQIAIDKDQNAYVADGYGRTIWKIGADGKPSKFVSGDPFSNPVGLTFQGDNLLVADPRSKDFLYSVDPAGQITPVPMAAN